MCSEHSDAMLFTKSLQKGCTRLAAASDKVYQLLVHGRWFSLGTPASSTTKAGRHDIAEILLKVGLSTKKSINQSKSIFTSIFVSVVIFVLFVCVLFYLFITEVKMSASIPNIIQDVGVVFIVGCFAFIFVQLYSCV
jgi:hypothetical protein